MTVQMYLARRRQIEIVLWILFLIVLWLVQFTVVYLEHLGGESRFQPWEFLVWEGTSIFVVGLLFPLILFWDRRFPLNKETLARHLIIHLLLTLPWSLLHVVAMVALRTVIYSLEGGSYNFGHWGIEFFYEYLKDFRTYGFLLGSVYFYRFLLRRMQSEPVPRSHDGRLTDSVERPERLLIKKLGKEFLVNVRDIEWVEAAGNYVNLHLGDRIYPLRDTMAKLLERLDPVEFVRVHRSYIVRLDSIAEITPLESGDARICLKGGQQIPVSRRYRDLLKARLKPN
ncbi:LytTR family DNA-binding domain-containing protein [Microbulbifer sp. THAF38]|uniref:LytR/AlgR family response regulator transcription factor n=1 Tax=Microbulbifer sp. THAF38 TaxID=2587856 RepID=UPI001267FEFB|nr:LytTR family DNA-binding domain-containing protein [Microbulbifer sp. THAF38]QFT55500.1 CO-responsive transcriptional regulator RcoM [Microbulbifer sp. THAF38]